LPALVSSRLLLLALCLSVAACDGGFLVRGKLVASDQTALRDCTLSLTGPPHEPIFAQSEVSSDGFSTAFTVPPTRNDYTLTIACAGFRPQRVKAQYGVDMTTSKPLELGVIELQPNTR
jgi:hypothetical protein